MQRKKRKNRNSEDGRCPMCAGTGRLIEWSDVEWGDRTDAEIASEMGVYRETVTVNRNKLGIPSRSKRMKKREDGKGAGQ